MIIASEKAIQKATTRPRLSVPHTSFLWALFQELVRSTTHRFVATCGAALPFSEIAAFKSRPRSLWRVASELRGRLAGHERAGRIFRPLFLSLYTRVR